MTPVVDVFSCEMPRGPVLHFCGALFVSFFPLFLSLENFRRSFIIVVNEALL